MSIHLTEVFGVLALSTSLAIAQTEIKKVPIQRTPADSGASMYFTYCASCHGADGKGNGPAAAALKMGMPDLTLLSKNNNGDFPASVVMMTLGRNRGAGPHGSSDMPIWGDVFRASGSNETEAQLRLFNLTNFIQQMQVPAERKPRPAKVTSAPVKVVDVSAKSGSAMYASFCASCHGASGTGDGPASASLKVKPSDLTMLVKNNGGDFPANKVKYILGSMPGTIAHGSKEMPVWGDVFRASDSNPSVATMRIANLTEHLKKMQK